MNAERDEEIALLESVAEPHRDMTYAFQPFAAEAIRDSSASSKMVRDRTEQPEGRAELTW
jgi:hypothetical protein